MGSFINRSGVKACLAAGVAAMVQAVTITAQPPAAGGATRFKEPDPIDFSAHAGFVQIFDGATLKGWDGNPAVWRVENGVLVGESTPERPSP